MADFHIRIDDKLFPFDDQTKADQTFTEIKSLLESKDLGEGCYGIQLIFDNSIKETLLVSKASIKFLLNEFSKIRT